MSHMVLGKATPRAQDAHHPKSSSMTLHAHGDGSYHTTPNTYDYGDGRVDHESFGAAMAHMALHHAPADQDHMMLTAHDEGTTTHHVKDGKKSGPHDQKNMKELMGSMRQFLREESEES